MNTTPANMQSQIQAERAHQTHAAVQRLFDEVMERDEAIRAIESDMNELNALFVDMRTLVKDQTKTIDCIEANVENAVHSTDQGVVELAKANQHHESSCIIC